MKLITDGEEKIVVLSAMSGTTNSLVEICNYLGVRNKATALLKIGQLEQKYKEVVTGLLKDDENIKAADFVLEGSFDLIKIICFRSVYQSG